jgi:hypothetical protein
MFETSGAQKWVQYISGNDMRFYSAGDRMTLQSNGNVGIGTTIPTQGRLVLSDSAQNSARLVLSGQEFYGANVSSSDGVAFLLGVNRTGNKQLWIADSSALTPNSTNVALRALVISGSVTIDAVGTDGLTPKQLGIGNSGGVYVPGNVGIGKNNPTVALDVQGDIKASGNIAAKYQDVAEWVPSSEQVAAGTVLVLDTTKSNQVISSTVSYDTRVAGVVSEQPGITLGESGAGKVLVATTGRVLVKVDASQGAIHIGDLLVTSDVPGVAMKSEPVKVGNRMMHLPGTLIGKALEPLERGSGKILVLLSLQ